MGQVEEGHKEGQCRDSSLRVGKGGSTLGRDPEEASRRESNTGEVWLD